MEYIIKHTLAASDGVRVQFNKGQRAHARRKEILIAIVSFGLWHGHVQMKKICCGCCSGWLGCEAAGGQALRLKSAVVTLPKKKDICCFVVATACEAKQGGKTLTSFVSTRPRGELLLFGQKRASGSLIFMVQERKKDKR